MSGRWFNLSMPSDGRTSYDPPSAPVVPGNDAMLARMNALAMARADAAYDQAHRHNGTFATPAEILQRAAAYEAYFARGNLPAAPVLNAIAGGRK